MQSNFSLVGTAEVAKHSEPFYIQPFKSSTIINLMSYFPSVFPQPQHLPHHLWSFQFLYTPASLLIIVPSSCTLVCGYLWAPKFDTTPTVSLSRVQLSVTPWTIQSMEFSRPEYWSGFECWVLSQLFHSLLSPSSTRSLVPFRFLPLGWYYLHIMVDISPSNDILCI